MTSPANLANQLIVVTGGGRGIGLTIARAIAAQGAKPVLVSRSLEEIEKASAMIRKETGSECISKVCDVSDYTQVHSLVEGLDHVGPITGLVHAAGVYGPIGPIEETDPNEWRRAVEINLIGTFNVVHAVVPAMKRRKSGRIVLFSGGGQGAMPHFSSYVTSKGGVMRMTETLGTELAPFGIFVNAIAPGAVNTRFLDDLLAAGEKRVGKEIYQKSLQQLEDGGASPDKAADLALYLLGAASRGLFGKTLSALWDPYRKFENLDHMSKSDLFTFKRVVDPEGGTRAK